MPPHKVKKSYGEVLFPFADNPFASIDLSGVRVSQELERLLLSNGVRFVVGVDEAGRGPLAGPVVAAAFLWDLEWDGNDLFDGLDDSKRLSAAARNRLFDELSSGRFEFAIAASSPQEIDSMNILNATALAMERALELLFSRLEHLPQAVFIDGDFVVDTKVPAVALVGGDRRFRPISAASILAKVYRDSLMTMLDEFYRQYSFSSHKGYGTAKHRAEILAAGLSPVHRKSFCKNLLSDVS